MEWVTDLWRYLGDNCKDLSIVNQWPVLPTKDNYLVHLTNCSNVITDTLPLDLQLIVTKLGCHIVDYSVTQNQNLLTHFVQNSTPSGVLLSIYYANGKCLLPRITSDYFYNDHRKTSEILF